MKIALIALVRLLAGIGIGVALGGAPVDYSAPDNIDYLIAQMEIARDTHQDIADNPERWSAWIKGGVDHRIWVETYDDILEILRDLK